MPVFRRMVVVLPKAVEPREPRIVPFGTPPNSHQPDDDLAADLLLVIASARMAQAAGRAPAGQAFLGAVCLARWNGALLGQDA